jgi:hypothetical protein
LIIESNKKRKEDLRPAIIFSYIDVNSLVDEKVTLSP